MKALIFGVTGQDGYYLKDLLTSNNISVIGVSRSKGDWVQGDISDYKFVEELIKSEEPDYIFHFAAKSTTKHEALFENHESIATGTINILESVRCHSFHSKVFITGSGVQFMNSGQPISENDPFYADSPYSLSRIHSVYAARYFRKLGVKVYVGYLFHHESPMRKENHLSKIIVNGVKKIATGSDVKIRIGDLSVKKEWAYAKDIVEGIFTLVGQDEYFEATIGTGIPYSIEQWLDLCFRQINKNWEEYVIIEEAFKAEYKLLYSNPETINRCGWKAKTSINELVKIMLP